MLNFDNNRIFYVSVLPIGLREPMKIVLTYSSLSQELSIWKLEQAKFGEKLQVFNTSATINNTAIAILIQDMEKDMVKELLSLTMQKNLSLVLP